MSTTTTLHVPVDAELHDLIRQAAFDRRCSMASIVRDAIRNHLTEETPK